MVLDWEEDKSLRILHEQRLICLLRLEFRCNSRDSLGLRDDWLRDDDIGDNWGFGVEGHVLLANSLEVELLDWRVGHLEIINCRSSLSRVSHVLLCPVDGVARNVIPALKG